MEPSVGEMRGQLTKFTSALLSFASSPDTLRVITSTPHHGPPPNLYVLDSSFNPPTLAHLYIATSALQQHQSIHPKRLLLLLATENADKAPKPASFEHRLMLMTIFAHDLLKTLLSSSSNLQSSPPYTYTPKNATDQRNSVKIGAGQGPDYQAEPERVGTQEQPIVVDIALTKHPYFIHKAHAITASGIYPAQTTQTHLIGYDTLVRILDPKYYPPDHTLAVLEPFFVAHRLRVTYRAGADRGEREAQDAYIGKLGRGEAEAEGARREWVKEGKIMLIEGRENARRESGEVGKVISSTRAREAARVGDELLLGKLVTEGVKRWILEQKLYLGD